MSFILVIIGTCMQFTISKCLDFRVVDLSHVHGPKPLTAPFFPQYNFSIVNRSISNELGGIWFEVNYIKTSEHSGTHIDAPSHFYKNRLRMHQIPLENLIGPGVIIDIKQQASQNPLYEAKVSDLQRWERKYGRIPKGAIVLLNSGWHKKYPDPNLVFNTNNLNDITTYKFPSWHLSSLRWLLRNRSVKVVGTDAPSLYSPAAFDGYIALFERNIPVVLFAANLDAVPDHGSTVFVPAINIYDGSGAPVRIFATAPISNKKYNY